MTLTSKKKGQASAEYITLVAGGALFVLIVIVAVNGFFNAPAKQTVIEQGALVQTQVGSLSAASNTGNPITIRTPKQYNGLTAFPVTFTFQVNECLTKAELYTDYPDAYQLRETLLEADLPVGGLATFQYTIQQETPFTYDILVTPCEGAEFRTPELDLSAVDPQAPAYQDAVQNDLQAGAPIGTPTKPTITLKGEYPVGQACNAGLCTYTFDFVYDLNKNVQTAQLQFLDSNNQPANIAQANANSIQSNAKSSGQNTFRTTVTTRDPSIPGATPTLDQYKWQLNACTTPGICATSNTNNFDFFVSNPDFTVTLGRNADGLLYFDCSQFINGDVGGARCSGTTHFNFAYNGLNPAMGFQATLILIDQEHDFQREVRLTNPGGGVNQGDVNKDVSEPSDFSQMKQWNVKICKNAQCGYAQTNGQIQSGPYVAFDDLTAECAGANSVRLGYLFTPNGNNLANAYITSTNLGDRELPVNALESGVQKTQNLVVSADRLDATVTATIKVCTNDNVCSYSTTKTVNVPAC